MNQLVEQCKNQADPEEIKKLQEEKKQLVTQHKSATEEAQKLKVKGDAMRNEITRLQAEINVKKVSFAISLGYIVSPFLTHGGCLFECQRKLHCVYLRLSTFLTSCPKSQRVLLWSVLLYVFILECLV